MFEIISNKIPSSWRIDDPYGSGLSITLEPESWLVEEFWDKKAAA